MSTDRWRRADELFEAALALAPEDRAAFLNEACADDIAIRQEIESLLSHHEQAGDEFMQPPQPPAGVKMPPTAGGSDPLIGTTVGRYHIKSAIASGGMATVYEAVQQEPHRVVALKVMHRHVTSRSALRRFQFESQVLARLRHPNIAQVYEAGTHGPPTDRGGEGADIAETVPYFALEYIPGAKTITQYARETALSTRERLELFATVCDAVQHGHTKGIIHRDLKPANILVDSAGQPKVIDFGVARATDSDLAITTQQTVIGQLVGTMQYMSPEQCDADPHDLDTRTDVYSLGVVLYELLTGELPYEASTTTIYQAARVIKEQAPRALSVINPKLRGDVDTIALKSLEKDRNKRYQSAAELAADIRRHLNREPIQAKPPTTWTRALRWVARHPAAAATAMTCFFTVAITVAATVGAVWALNRRPDRIVRSDDEHKARLLSVTGNELYVWVVEPPGKIKSAELVGRPREYGGGKLAVLGFRGRNRYAAPGALCAFDTKGDLSTPVWANRVEGAEVPASAPEREYHDDSFCPEILTIADIFPEHPGREIVAVHTYLPHSQCAVRVYGVEGATLYQVWQDGGVAPRGTYWMPHPGLLVFSGLHGTALWSERGYPEVDYPYPQVIFSVRPEMNAVGTEFLGTTPGTGPLKPVWHRCLLPPDLAGTVHLRLDFPVAAYDPARYVRLFLNTGTGRRDKGFSWTLDEHGEIVSDAQVVDDYCKGDKALPDPGLFRLGPLPPIVSTSDGAEQPSTTQPASQ